MEPCLVGQSRERSYRERRRGLACLSGNSGEAISGNRTCPYVGCHLTADTWSKSYFHPFVWNSVTDTVERMLNN